MKKVYIVDDDKDIVEALTMILESKGYEIGHQLSEENVVENVRSFGPDLLILDVMFPENDSAGFDMARAIKGRMTWRISRLSCFRRSMKKARMPGRSQTVTATRASCR